MKTGESTELRISGMTCASCVAHVGRALRSVPGVSDAAVNLATEQARIMHDPAVETGALVAAVEAAGYGAAPAAGDEDARVRDAAMARKGRLLILSVVLCIPTVVLGMAPVAFPGKDWLMFALTLPVWLIVAADFHRSAIAGLRHRAANMDTLVSLGSTAAFGYSVYATIAHQPSYYETASAIVTLIYAGKYLETVSRTRSNRALRALLGLRPAIAHIRTPSGAVDDIRLEDVQRGDRLIVAAGERIPVDGIVEEGQSFIDVSMLTGEPLPVAAAPASTVKQGTLNGDGTLVVRAQEVGAGTTLARIVELVRRAQGSTPDVQRLADRVAGVFVPAILLIAAATFIVWLLTGHGWALALTIAIAVVIVACPCALGLATPLAVIAGVGAGARYGLLFRDAQALERLGSVQTVFFDKTGTLTSGKPHVVRLETSGSADDLLATAAAVERLSTHPLAYAIVRAAEDRAIRIPAARDVAAERGGGLAGSVQELPVLVGSAAFLQRRGITLDGLASTDYTRIYVARDGKLIGAIDVGDPARSQSTHIVSALQREGIAVQLVSGDAAEPTRSLARELGISNWYAQASPEEKAEIVARERARGGGVAFVGDGINDAPALAAADVGIAMGSGAEVALETAQIAILSNDPMAVVKGISLSRATLRKIKQNLFWAFAYNILLVPLAAAGMVHPILAAAAMGASSLFVVGNSFLLAGSEREDR